MHSSIVLSICLLPAALGSPHSNHGRDSTLKPKHYTWSEPAEGDVRAPCPVLNTLANHEFLPHNGRNITVNKAIDALGDALNIAPALATTLFTGGLRTNPTPNATWFDLDMLHAHNVLEHDGSLSRRDMHFDTSNAFDPATFAAFLDYFANDTMVLDVNATAAARARHAYEMSKINQDFTITKSSLQIMMGETALMMLVWGSAEEPGADREFFEYFFRNERLPVALGWTPGETEIGTAVVSEVIAEMVAASPSDVPLVFEP